MFTFAMACPSRLRVYQENHMINAVIEKKPMVRNFAISMQTWIKDTQNAVIEKKPSNDNAELDQKAQ